MPHFEWLGVAGSGPPAWGALGRVLLAVVLGWTIVGIILAVVRLFG